MNVNPSKFTQKELATIYEQLILLWELDLSQNAHFDMRSKKYRATKEKFGLSVNCVDTELETQEKYDCWRKEPAGNKNYLLFHNQKKNLLLSLLYMLRNAAGHGGIKIVKRSNRKFYALEHMYKQKIKLYGQIKAADFWELHKALVGLKSIRRKS